jgi:hypothetical protein
MATIKGNKTNAAEMRKKNIFIGLILIFLATALWISFGQDGMEYGFDTGISQTTPAVRSSATAPAFFFTHPMLSIEPSATSLHAEHKLWTEMYPAEQDAALDKVGVYLTKYGKLLGKRKNSNKITIKQGDCELIEFATGHALCGPKPENDCTFFSFGINDDPSFDQALAEKWNCRGFAGDPTVHHPSKLHPLVTFHNIGASMISDNEERLINKGGQEQWWSTSMTKLRFFLGLDHVNIVKLDCEGCEFALSRDILREDPTFLHRVDQLSIETHVTKTWLKTREDLYYFGLHFLLLEEAGFKLEWSQIFGCSKRHEDEGCIDEIEGKYGYPVSSVDDGCAGILFSSLFLRHGRSSDSFLWLPSALFIHFLCSLFHSCLLVNPIAFHLLSLSIQCGFEPWPKHPKVVIGRSCQDFLWKRY